MELILNTFFLKSFVSKIWGKRQMITIFYERTRFQNFGKDLEMQYVMNA
jgi:hypothetical protein